MMGILSNATKYVAQKAKVPAKAKPNQTAIQNYANAASRGATSGESGGNYMSTRPYNATDIYKDAAAVGTPLSMAAALDLHNKGYSPSGGGGGAAPAVARPSAGGGSSSASRGRSGGGGGGGGGAAALEAQYGGIMANTLTQTKFMLDLMNTLKADPNDALRGKVNSAVDADLGASNTAIDQLRASLGQINAVNPYANLQAQSTQQQPNLSALLQAQGGGDAQYQAQLQGLNQQGSQMANNWNNMYGAQGANYTAGVQSQNAQAEMARAQGQQTLGAQRSALLAMVDQQDQAKKAAVDQQKQQYAMQLMQLIAGANAQLPMDHQLGQATLAQMGMA